MHQRLRLRSPRIENRSRPPQDLQNMRIFLADSPYPAHKPRIQIEIFHADMFLDADRNTVQRTNGLAQFLEVGVKVCGTFEGAGGEQLCYAVCLVSISRCMFVAE